jgi:hypothetical protein
MNLLARRIALLNFSRLNFIQEKGKISREIHSFMS